MHGDRAGIKLTVRVWRRFPIGNTPRVSNIAAATSGDVASTDSAVAVGSLSLPCHALLLIAVRILGCLDIAKNVLRVCL